MSKAMELFQAAFAGPRDARSPEYRDGVLNALRFRLNEASEIRCPHRSGTAAADAFFAGCEEGHRLAREYLETGRLPLSSTPDAGTTSAQGRAR